MKRLAEYKYMNWKVLFAAITVILFGIFFDSITDNRIFKAVMAGDVQYIRASAFDSWLYAYGFMLFIMIIQNSFTVIPLILVITINIALFGFLKGFLWSWFSSVVAGAIVFGVIRYLLYDFASRKISAKQLSRIEENGFAYVFSARVMPLVPTSLVNILSGLSSIGLKSFILGTALGNFIYFFLLGLVPAGVISSDVNNYVLAAILIGMLTVFWWLGRFKRRKNRKMKISMKSIWYHK